MLALFTARLAAWKDYTALMVCLFMYYACVVYGAAVVECFLKFSQSLRVVRLCRDNIQCVVSLVVHYGNSKCSRIYNLYIVLTCGFSRFNDVGWFQLFQHANLVWFTAMFSTIFLKL